MVNFFKSVGKGILYILFIPAIIVVIAVAAVGAVGIFFYELGKSVGLFFMGKNIFQDLPEDEQAKAIIDLNKKLSSQIIAGGTPTQEVTNNTTTNNTTYNNIIIMSTEEDLIKLMSGQSSIPENTNIKVIEAEKPKEIIENEPLQIEEKDSDFSVIPNENEQIITHEEEKQVETKLLFSRDIKRTPRPSIKPVKQTNKKSSEATKQDEYEEDDDDDDFIEPGGGVTIR